jgi:hypothetical protein
MEFINNRKNFKNNGVDGNFLQDNFYNKYNKNPVKFQEESLLKYVPLEPLDNVVIDNNTQLLVINGFICLINSIIADNDYLINKNPLIRKDENSSSVWKKIIWNKKYKTIELTRIINFYFFSAGENVGVNINQEYLLDKEKHIITTRIIINGNNYTIVKVNETPITTGDPQYMAVEFNIRNLNIIGTVLSILAAMNGNKKNILMLRNIKSDLYGPLINNYHLEGSIHSIESMAVTHLMDNLYRCKIVLTVALQKKKKTVEEYFDFDCPSYSFPQLVNVPNKE